MPLFGIMLDMDISNLNHLKFCCLPKIEQLIDGFYMETECTFMLYKQGTRCILHKNGPGLKTGITGRSNGAVAHRNDCYYQQIKDGIGITQMDNGMVHSYKA